MNLGFWKKLKKPFFVLAPMADVTDVAFRQIIAKYGKPDVFWTEFVPCDGLCSKGREVLLRDLDYEENERPIVAQLFGGHPENFYKTAQLIKELGFDGVDINMGCPDRSIEKQGAGASLIKNPELAQEIIKETKRGAGDLPVSVKTRIGYNKNEIETWLPILLKAEPSVITIHGRTRKEMSKVPNDWNVIKRAVEIRNEMKSQTLIIGNGDINNLTEAEEAVKQSGVDGVMIGRGIFGNPWFFNKEINTSDISTADKLRVLIEHTKVFEEKLGGIKPRSEFLQTQKSTTGKNFAIMKKHYKAYVTGFDGAKELRIKLMEAQNATEVENLVNDYLG